jgi:hypothetical protein
VAIVQEYRYWLPEPNGGKDQVNGEVAINVASLDE